MHRTLVLSILMACPLAIGCGDDGGTGPGSSSSSSSGDSTGAPTTTTDATMTNATMTEGGSSSGSADTTTATTTSDTTASDTTAETTEGSESTGTVEVDYPPCMPGEDPICPEPYTECYDFEFPDFSACTQPCMQDNECPVPQTGTATAVCAGMDGNQCLLNCANDATCPDGMECVDVAGMGMFFRCLWPA